jgi:hypothetical protein
MVKVNYLPNTKISEKLVRKLYQKAFIKTFFYMVLCIPPATYIFSKGDIIYILIALSVISYYAYRLYQVIQAPKKLVRRINAGLIRDELSIDDHELTMKSYFTHGEQIVSRKLAAFDALIYSKDGLLLLSGNSVFIVLDGQYEVGSFDEIIDILSKYSTIKITKL